MMEFFKLVGRNSAEIGSQKGARRDSTNAGQQWPADRPVNQRAQCAQA